MTWPYEAVSDQEEADEFKVVCRVVDDMVQGYKETKRSNIWDAVVVPADISPTGKAEVGYIPELWVELPPNKIIEDCSEAENPAGAPLATTPTP